VTLELLLVCWANTSAHVALGYASVLDTPLRHVALWLPARIWAPRSAHVALGLRWKWPTPTPHFRTPGAWVTALDPRGMSLASRPMINGSSVRTQFYWVLHQEPRFRGPRILNIIFCFRNIIIFIIISILNKIINKFHRKYYY